MNVIDAAKRRRSIRKYKTDPISEETLNIVVDAARWAPSWAEKRVSGKKLLMVLSAKG